MSDDFRMHDPIGSEIMKGYFVVAMRFVITKMASIANDQWVSALHFLVMSVVRNPYLVSINPKSINLPDLLSNQ